MALIPEKHVFVCITNRPPMAGASCGGVGSQGIMEDLQMAVMEKELMDKVRLTGCTCLGPCDDGVNMVIYPEGVFYAHVTADDVNEIVDSHFIGDKPVERLIFKGE